MNEYKVNQLLSKSGHEILEVNGFLLHSKYNPIREAELFVEKEYKENYLHILFGYGAGYIADILKEKLPKDDLIIVEPIEELTNEESILHTNISEIKKRITKGLVNKIKEIKVICSPNYDKIAPIPYKELLELVKSNQVYNVADINTVRLYSYEWQENYWKNLVYVLQDSSLKLLEKKYTNPVIIASSGPSLDKQLDKLKEIKDKVIILCAGSTVNPLLKNDIDPDYIVTIDGSEANYGHFKDIKTTATLLYCLMSKYNIQKEYQGNRIPFLAIGDENFQNFIEKGFGINIPIINGGVSVANFTFTIAQYITSGPIAFIGQDLAYTNNLSHSVANKYVKNIKNDEDLIEVDGYYDDKVKTSYPLLFMKNNFEELIKLSKHEAPIYNCTEGGARINGIEQISFNDFIKKFVDKKGSKNLAILSNEKGLLSKLDTVWCEHLNKIKKIKLDINNAIYLVKDVKRKGAFSNSTLNKLNKIDKKIEKVCEEVLLSHITQPLVKNILSLYKEVQNETEIQQFERIYSLNMALYKGLSDVVAFSEKFLEESLTILREEMGDKNE